MKLLLTTLLMLIPTTLNANGAGDDNDWKFISELTLTKEEKRVEVNKMITAIKESDNTQ